MNDQIPSYTIEALLAGENNPAKEFDLFQFEYFARDIEHLKMPHRHYFYTFILVTGGGGSHDIDFNTYALQPNRLFLIAPGQVHAWNNLDHIKGFVLLFTDNFVALSKGRKLLANWPLFQPGQLCYVDIHSTEMERWVKQFNAIEDEMKMADRYMRDAVFYAIGNLLVCTSRQYEAVDPHYYSSQDLLFKFQELIEQNFVTLKAPKEYARLLHVTPNYLNTFCKKRSGKSAGELIRQRIILEAKRLLAHTQLPVAQVAYQLNFEDNSYFGRFFKKYAGETPDTFRKK